MPNERRVSLPRLPNGCELNMQNISNRKYSRWYYKFLEEGAKVPRRATAAERGCLRNQDTHDIPKATI